MILILVLKYRWCTLLAARQGSGSGMYLHRAWQDVCSEPRLLRMQNGNFMTCALSDLLQVCRPPWLQGCNGSGWDPLLVPAAAYRSFQTGVPCYETTLSMMSESWPVICFLTFWQTDLHCGSSLCSTSHSALPSAPSQPLSPQTGRGVSSSGQEKQGSD